MFVQAAGLWVQAVRPRVDPASMTRIISGVALILWGSFILLSFIIRGLPAEGGAFGVGQLASLAFAVLLLWLGRRAVIKGAADRAAVSARSS